MRNADLYHILPRPDGKNWDGVQYYDPASGEGEPSTSGGPAGESLEDVRDEVDRPVRRLGTVRVGDREALVQQQASGPRRAIVGGEERCQMGAVFRALLGPQSVFDQQQIAGAQTPEMVPGADVPDRAALRYAPGPAVVR